MRRSECLLVFTAAALSACTTYVQPTTCEQDSTACGGIHDARFCHYLALSIEGADCPQLGVVESKLFCVVEPGLKCIRTNYAVKDRDCRVLGHQLVRDSARADCPLGAPMFVNP